MRGYREILALVLTAACAGPPAEAPPGATPAPEPAPPPEPISSGPGLPEIPFVDGPLALHIIHPSVGQLRPNVDSVFIYGSTGTGRAKLSVNGIPIGVAPNGAFLAYVARPADDTLRLTADAGGQVISAMTWYSPPAASAATPPAVTTDYSPPRPAVTIGRDTLANGSDVVIGRPSPTGTYRWFLPAGARITLTGERGEMFRVRLDSETEAWLPKADVAEDPSRLSIEPVSLAQPVVRSSPEWTDVVLPVSGAPFRVEARDSTLVLTLHGVRGEHLRLSPTDPVIALIEAAPDGETAITVRIYPRSRIWGFKAYYAEDGSLVLRVRKPPVVNPGQPLGGVRIAVDPGHPPGGATGPTGLREAEANLAIALRLTELLREAGADVLVTRPEDAEVSLGDRVEMAVRWNAHMLVSVHNNAFPEGVDPYARAGTSTYYFHPFSRELANEINREILAVTTVRDLGVIQGNLALARPTWMPAVLTESLFMPIPDQEAALRDPGFISSLALAHLKGIERFLRTASGPEVQ